MTDRFRHVVFDLDGTLADTARDIAHAANHVRRACGLPELPVSAVRDYIGEGARRLVARVLPAKTSAEVDDALQMFLRHYEAHLLDETALYPGIAALLGALERAGITCSVLSNKPAVLCRRIVDGLGVGQYFDIVLGGDSLPARKPDPCGIRHVESRLGLAPSAILLVGDSLTDRDTANAAGAVFCGVAWGFASQTLYGEGVAHMATTPDDILALCLPRLAGEM